MSENESVVIKVQDVYKDFRLPHDKNSTLKGTLVNALRGKKNRTISTQHALKDISFEIKKGEFFGIVGRNGSGKSTLLKILAGIYQPTKGTVSVHGKLVPFIELGVGFNPELTGKENVYLNGSLLGFSKDEVDVMYDEIVEFAELSRFMDQKLKNYSSGMQVRLAFSLAIRADTDILLVDEVLAVGDADFQRKCFDYFRQLKRNKKTVVFVSHDMSSVRQYCDKAIMIEKSKIIASGTADRIATKYTRMFLEEAKTDKYQAKKESNRWGSGALTYTAAATEVTEEQIVIKLETQAHASIDSPNFGFSIRDANGQILLGTNSQIKRHTVGTIKENHLTQIVWELPNIFNDGTYSLDVAAVSPSGEVWDWWEDATSFKVLKDERTPYSINPQITLKVGTDS